MIEKADCCDQVVTAENGIEALKYLRDSGKTTPDLILLDINMPRMNGWQFLEEYAKLETSQKAHATVVMLTTALRSSEEDKASMIDDITDLIPKPLTAEGMTEIVKRFFGHT